MRDERLFPLFQPLDALPEREGILDELYRLADRGDPDVIAIIARQASQFETRAHNLRTQRQIHAHRIEQLAAQAEGLARQRDGVRRELALVRDEAADVRTLVAAKLERKPRLVALLRDEAELIATDGEVTTAFARNEEAVGETRLQLLTLETRFRESVAAQLTEMQAKRMSAEKLYRGALDRLSRMRIESPVDGIVLATRIKTIGGVVKAGAAILDIVPDADEMVVNAQVRTTDVDEVALGSEASVVLHAFHDRNMDRVPGVVAHVSADAFEDESTGTRFYRVEIRLDAEHLAGLTPSIELAAGMPAEVFITTAERTLADYLAAPVRATFERAFRES